jgi:hypothetical protein
MIDIFFIHNRIKNRLVMNANIIRNVGMKFLNFKIIRNPCRFANVFFSIFM